MLMQAPPQPIGNVEAEAVLLGALMVDPKNIDYAADRLTPEDFLEPVHGRIFEAIVAEAGRGGRPTPITLFPLFAEDPAMKHLGGPGYLAQLTGNSAVLLGFKGCVRQVADLGIRRRLGDALVNARTDAAHIDTPVTTIVEDVEGAIAQALAVKAPNAQLTGVQAMGRLLKRLDDDRSTINCRCIPTLDNLLGGLRRTELLILAARPGMGKTAVAVSYVLGAAQAGHGVLFVSLEMGAEELAARAAADLSTYGQAVPYSDINSERPSRNALNAIHDAQQRMEDMPLMIFDAGGITLGRLSALVRRVKRQMAAKGDRLDLVVIDYLQLLRGDRQASRYELITEISIALKALAKDNNVAVMALSQLSREVEKREDKRPQLSDLRESGQIEQDADAVVFLLREEYYLRREKPEGWEAALSAVEGDIEFIQAKRRNGMEGSAKGRFSGQYQAVRG